MSSSLSRRRFFQLAASLAATGCSARLRERRVSGEEDPFFLGRGAVMGIDEVQALGGPQWIASCGINVLDLGQLSEWVATTAQGQSLLAECQKVGLDVEFSLHAPSVFLPRSLFEKDPTMFRMDESGKRTPDSNLCVSSEAAIEVFCENAEKHAKLVRPTSHRYHYWIDDGQSMCRCPKCREFSDSDQALLLEHRLLGVLRKSDPQATLSHLAYQKTLLPPSQIRPDRGIFLQFAPIERDSLKSLSRQGPISLSDGTSARLLDLLQANLKVFGSSGAEVLEYWLDNSRFSGWDRAKIGKIPWNRDVLLEDLESYALAKVRHTKTYAFWFDAAYVQRYGKPPVDEYSRCLREFRGEESRPRR